MIEIILFLIIVLVASSDYLFSKFKKKDTKDLVLHEIGETLNDKPKNILLRKTHLGILVFFSVLFFVALIIDYNTYQPRLLLSEATILVAFIVLYTLFSINAVLSKYKLKKIIAREFLYLTFTFILAIIMFGTHSYVYNSYDKTITEIEDVVSNCEKINNIIVPQVDYNNRYLSKLGFNSKEEVYYVNKYYDLLKYCFKVGGFLMISSDDLIKYKNETGNSEHESIDFTQISSITNHIDDKLIVNGKGIDTDPSNYILHDYLVEKIVPKYNSSTIMSTYFIGYTTTVADIEDKYVREIMLQKKCEIFGSIKGYKKQRILNTVGPNREATLATRFLNGDSWYGSLGMHQQIAYHGRGYKSINHGEGATYDLTNKVGEYYFISSRGEFIHVSNAQKYIDNLNYELDYTTGKAGAFKKDCSIFRCTPKKKKLYDEYYVTVSESKYKDNLLMINEKEFDKKYNTSLYKKKNIITLESDWNGIVNSKKDRINVSFLRQLKPILYDHEQNEFNWLTSFFILAYVYRFGISIIVLLVLAIKWAMKTYFTD